MQWVNPYQRFEIQPLGRAREQMCILGTSVFTKRVCKMTARNAANEFLLVLPGQSAFQSQLHSLMLDLPSEERRPIWQFCSCCSGVVYPGNHREHWENTSVGNEVHTHWVTRQEGFIASRANPVWINCDLPSVIYFRTCLCSVGVFRAHSQHI